MNRMPFIMPKKANKVVEPVIFKPLTNGQQIGIIPTLKRASIPTFITPATKTYIKSEDTSMYDRVIPNMYLEADYVCEISYIDKKGGIKEKTYNWKMIQPTNGVKYKYNLCHYYTNSEGDLHITAKVDGTIISQLIINDDNLSLTDSLYAESSNITENRVHRVKAPGSNMIELCTLSYGEYTKAYKNSMFNDIDLSIVFTYNRRDYVNNQGKTTYCGALMIDKGNEEYGISLIKEIIKLQKKTTIVFTPLI